MHENRETSGVSRADRDRSEKALSRTAGMYAPEESDCAVVPVNRPNKERQLLAEAGEGRVQTKENSEGSYTSPTRSGKRVSQGLGGVRRTAKERRQEKVQRFAPPSERGSTHGKAFTRYREKPRLESTA